MGSIKKELEITIGDVQYLLIPNEEVVLSSKSQALTYPTLFSAKPNVPFPRLTTSC